MRNEFEKLPEVARLVACDEIKWCEVYNWYRTDNTDANSIYHVAWLNGAWYAFQEQQKKIDELKTHVALLSKMMGECNQWTNSAHILGTVDGFLEAAKGILK